MVVDPGGWRSATVPAHSGASRRRAEQHVCVTTLGSLGLPGRAVGLRPSGCVNGQVLSPPRQCAAHVPGASGGPAQGTVLRKGRQPRRQPGRTPGPGRAPRCPAGRTTKAERKLRSDPGRLGRSGWGAGGGCAPGTGGGHGKARPPADPSWESLGPGATGVLVARPGAGASHPQASLTRGFFHSRLGLSGPPLERALTSPFPGGPASLWWESSPQAGLWDSPWWPRSLCQTPALVPLLEVTAERRPGFPRAFVLSPVPSSPGTPYNPHSGLGGGGAQSPWVAPCTFFLITTPLSGGPAVGQGPCCTLS